MNSSRRGANGSSQCIKENIFRKRTSTSSVWEHNTQQPGLYYTINKINEFTLVKRVWIFHHHKDLNSNNKKLFKKFHWITFIYVAHPFAYVMAAAGGHLPSSRCCFVYRSSLFQIPNSLLISKRMLSISLITTTTTMVSDWHMVRNERI